MVSTLYNKGLDVRLMNVNTWGVTYFMTTDPAFETWADLAGKTVYIPLQSSPPDALTQYFLNEAGLTVGEDVEIVYASTAEVAALSLIHIFHPLVIWFEYHFTQSIWPVFLIAGLLCLIAALFIPGLFSVLLGLLGVACIWSIRELKEQARRVERGWFPKNPKRK